MKALPMHFDWDPVLPARSVKIPPGSLRLTVSSLCRRAGIPIRATSDRIVYVYRGKKKVKTPAFDLVGVSVSARSREGALRALEKLAYSFFDHCARYCVCARGYFTAQAPPRKRAAAARVRALKTGIRLAPAAKSAMILPKKGP